MNELLLKKNIIVDENEIEVIKLDSKNVFVVCIDMKNSAITIKNNL